MNLEHITRVAYSANRAYAKSLGERVPSWSQAPSVDRMIWLHAIRFHIEYPFATPAAIQEKWLQLEREAGWSYGPALDNDAKQHPHHVTWDQLPHKQQRKVVMIRSIVRALTMAVPSFVG